MSPQIEFKQEAVAKKPRSKLREKIFGTTPRRPGAEKHQVTSSKKERPVEIDIKIGNLVNDNAAFIEKPRAHYLKNAACIAIFAAGSTIALTHAWSPLNIQNVAAYVVMNSNDWVLNYTMKHSPDSLAYALNAIGPSE